MQNEMTNPTEAPLLCDVLGLEAASFARFLATKEQALEKVDALAEQHIKDALLAEKVWPM